MLWMIRFLNFHLLVVKCSRVDGTWPMKYCEFENSDINGRDRSKQYLLCELNKILLLLFRNKSGHPVRAFKDRGHAWS
jgi:hypothetical protein